VSSGQLAINNCWSLGPEVLRKMEQKEATEREKRDSIEQKQQQRKQKDNSDFTNSIRRYRNNQPLKANDYKNLLRKIKHSDDSPLRTKVAEMKQQWNKRKHRLDVFMQTPENPNTTLCIEVPQVVRTMEL
jgi:benzoyl-CoA reductase/2-hydroxyglutaryl-CoA dehydratase subunit BcrC/BadD/HgdB